MHVSKAQLLHLLSFFCLCSLSCHANERSPNAELVVFERGGHVDVLVVSNIDGLCVEQIDLGSNLFLQRIYEGEYESIEGPVHGMKEASAFGILMQGEIVGLHLELAYLEDRFDFVSGETVRFLYSPLSPSNSECESYPDSITADYAVNP